VIIFEIGFGVKHCGRKRGGESRWD